MTRDKKSLSKIITHSHNRNFKLAEIKKYTKVLCMLLINVVRSNFENLCFQNSAQLQIFFEFHG